MNTVKLQSRHSGAGRNPDSQITSRAAGQYLGFVRYAGCLFLLDSGLRRNDAAIY
jgi:hypothetical protein